MSLLVTGTLALDTVSTPFGRIDEGLGGSAMHFSVSASFFTSVNMVVVVGEDFPKQHLDFLASKKIGIEGVEKIPGKTFRWTGHYDHNLNNAQTLKTDLNVLLEFDPKIPESLKNPDTLFLANLDPDIQLKVLQQVKRPRFVALDTMNFWIEGKREALLRVLKEVDALTINEGEARLLSGKSGLLESAKLIQKMGPQILVIKRGEYGALLFYKDQIFSAPGLPLESIKDPTGAGDSFAGGLMGYLSSVQEINFESLKQGVIVGSVMASFNVEEFSCDRFRNLTKSDIAHRYQIFKKLSHFEEVSAHAFK